MANDFLSNILKIFATVLTSLLGLLPDSPFIGMLQQIGKFDFLGYINWFIPFDFCLTCLNLWILCIGAQYIFTYAISIAKMIGAIK